MTQHIGQWKVDIFLYEDQKQVTAKAVLHADATEPVVGRGAARIHTATAVPEIGAELAASRALAALGRRLLELTTQDVAALHRRVPVDARVRGPAHPGS